MILIISFFLFIHGAVSTCTLNNNTEIKTMVDLWMTTNGTNHPCGEIGDWDISSVTDMSLVFCAVDTLPGCSSDRQGFNADISKWNVAGVENMERMFYGQGSSFDGNQLTCWDTSSVTNMKWLFARASGFIADVSRWKVSNETDTEDVFWDCCSALENCKKKLIYDSWTNQGADISDYSSWGALSNSSCSIESCSNPTPSPTPGVSDDDDGFPDYGIALIVVGGVVAVALIAFFLCGNAKVVVKK